MSDEKPLKSAFELAMERLRKSDEEAGIERRPLTDEQKASIAETRNYYEAKLAQEDVLHKSRMAGVFDPGERERMEQQFRRERERLSSERDAKIAKIRSGLP